MIWKLILVIKIGIEEPVITNGQLSGWIKLAAKKEQEEKKASTLDIIYEFTINSDTNVFVSNVMGLWQFYF